MTKGILMSLEEALSGCNHRHLTPRFSELLARLFFCDVEGKKIQICIQICTSDSRWRDGLESGELDIDMTRWPGLTYPVQDDFVDFVRRLSVWPISPGSVAVVVMSSDLKILRVAFNNDWRNFRNYKSDDLFVELRSFRSVTFHSFEYPCHQVFLSRTNGSFIVRSHETLRSNIYAQSHGSINLMGQATTVLSDLFMECSNQGFGFLAFFEEAANAYYHLRDRNRSVIDRGIGFRSPYTIKSVSEAVTLFASDGAVIVNALENEIRILDFGVYFSVPGGRTSVAKEVVSSLSEQLPFAIYSSEDGSVETRSKCGQHFREV